MITRIDIKPGAQFYLHNPFNLITVVKVVKNKVFFISQKGQEIATYCSIDEAINDFKKVVKNDKFRMVKAK